MLRTMAVAGAALFLALSFEFCSADGSIEKAKELLEAGDHTGARARLEFILERDSDNHEAHSDLGMVSLAEGDLDGAIESLKRAIELDDSVSSYHAWIGSAYIIV